MTVPLPIEGQCMCGEVRVRATAPPIITMACHCTGCQKMSASAFSMSVMFPAQGFEVIKGEPVVGALHRVNPYMFCPNCKNWLFTSVNGGAFVNVRPAMFDAPEWAVPFVESCVSEKLSWAATSARYSFDQFPPPDQYAKLSAEYAAWSASQ
ncbi:MAG TPA: GFA family protein [Hyphomonadaceae bacterium]|nr:GFA family protein [Hyphomonadaceae bacterium]